MSALPVNETENARRREDALRELKIYPLWQLRSTPGYRTTPLVGALETAPEEAALTPPTPLASAPPHAQMLVPAATELSWTALKKRVKNCTACALRAGCTQTVFGTGDENADWLFVGSWPTEDDDLKGEPFAGEAGQLLDNMLAAIKLKRTSKVYLANIVKCSGSIIRGPQADQIAQCAPYIARQIQLIQPKIIVALGHAAATALLGEDREWRSLLGKVHNFQSAEKNNSIQTIPLIITHHPAALLLTPLNKEQTWRDLCLAHKTMLEASRT